MWRIKRKFSPLALLVIVCGVFLLGGCGDQKNATSPTLQMKQEYVDLLDDKIDVEMITNSYSLIQQSINEKLPENNYIDMSKSVSTYNEFIAGAVERTKGKDEQKFKVYDDINKSITEIITIATSGGPLLEKDSDGNYFVGDKTSVTEKDLEKIKEIFNGQLEEYFE